MSTYSTAKALCHERYPNANGTNSALFYEDCAVQLIAIRGDPGLVQNLDRAYFDHQTPELSLMIDKLVRGFCISMLVLGVCFNQAGVLFSRNTMITAIVVVNMGLGWLFAHEMYYSFDTFHY